MHRIAFTVTVLSCLGSGAAVAQAGPPGLPGGPFPPGTIIQRQTNTTGNTVDYIIAPGATGADTITTNSAAGGNAGQPERAIPQGSAGGGSGGGSSR
ncbi:MULTISPECIES: hypothetical protein [Methylorubrum]|jgi:hypothetical protein|uniref:Uncharacterized protein n=4 Tax=Methylorubrum extorquens TaxID=408 RepID=C5ATP8_METEA|nr:MULTISPECIES: hypothetical protein [Methylorubrum]KQP87738.1 hypothetical protein ASF55_07945 [Methylobacterium sp. Leaf119]KQP99005.1 hypothetical protein ASF59_05970 [Methylobacterium sp. Leaf121]ABY31022.1 hypothetical protein Mext_2630 [Methylorubrum extorquens PA1]ACS40572.1 hypothetical protein; putative exported protein [Methylorubrum extorquens AM1]APX86872.1 hypothetical protein BV511_20510 [Methylorubrum extorquens]